MNLDTDEKIKEICPKISNLKLVLDKKVKNKVYVKI